MNAMKYSKFSAMSTDILLGAEGSESLLATAFGQARELIEKEAGRFTRFSEDSELARLNQANGDWSEVSAQMFDVLSLALDLHRETGGLFDPGILDALEFAGYNRTIQDLRVFGPAGDLQVVAPPRAPAFGGIVLDLAAGQVWLPQGLRIDLGGIAKGWIAEQAAESLAGWSENCLVDAGGDMLLKGRPGEGGLWRVALEDPRDSSRDLAVLKLPAGGVATSSVTKRRWQRNSRESHHLIDPRSGLPAQNAWLSVTAIAESLPVAEAWAKALLIAGPAEAGGFDLESRGVEYIAVDRDGKLWGSRNSKEFIDD